VKPKFICMSTLCSIPFYVYTSSDGGSFDCGKRRMNIDIMGESWQYCLSILLHEATECAFALHQLRFQPSNVWMSADMYLFNFDHPQFGKAIQDVAIFVSFVYAPLLKEYRSKHHA